MAKRWLIDILQKILEYGHVYQVESCIHGYHVYKDNWNQFIDEELDCVRETLNPMDVYAVAVVCSEITVAGHIPRKISATCSFFLRNGSIKCIVTGNRCHSSDLPQGDIEIPCKLIFKGKTAYITKIKKLLTINPSQVQANKTSLPSKKQKMCPVTPATKVVVVNDDNF